MSMREPFIILWTTLLCLHMVGVVRCFTVACFVVYPEAEPTLTLKKVTNELAEVSKWYFLGIQLEVPHKKLKEFESDYPKDSDRCKIEAIGWWLKNHPKPSWAVLVEALEAMKEFGVVNKIKAKYLTGMHSQYVTSSSCRLAVDCHSGVIFTSSQKRKL